MTSDTVATASGCHPCKVCTLCEDEYGVPVSDDWLDKHGLCAACADAVHRLHVLEAADLIHRVMPDWRP